MSSHGWGYMSAAAGAADCIRRAGVTRVFGIPAVATTELFAALVHSRVDVVLVTQETSAAHMAVAHAKVTGELGVCLLGPEVGTHHSLSGISLARMDSIPLLVLVASSHSAHQPAASYRQKVLDPLAGPRQLYKGVYSVYEAEEVPPVLSRAMQLARVGEPGPALVEIPSAVQRLSCRMEGTGFKEGPRVLTEAAAADLHAAAARMMEARQVGIYAGAGCLRAVDELLELAQRIEAPVATSVSGLGLLPAVHPLCAGFGPGQAGAPLVEAVFSDCDLILALGCRFFESTTDSPGSDSQPEWIYVDIEPTLPERGTPAAVIVSAPAKQALRFLIELLPERSQPGLRESIRAGKRRFRTALAARPRRPDYVDPVRFFSVLRDFLGADDRLILDANCGACFGVAAFAVHAPRTLVLPQGNRVQGFSIPGAVAAALALPDLKVVACVDEESFLLSAAELLTARRCNVAPVVALFTEVPSDADLSLSSRLLGRETAVNLVPINHQKMAEALGVGYVRIQCDQELEAGLKTALTFEAPVIVDVRVSYREAHPYLQGDKHKPWQHLSWPLALRLGAQFVQHRILED